MLERFKEPSTWAGIGMSVLTASGVASGAFEWKMALGTFLCAIGSIFLPERK